MNEEDEPVPNGDLVVCTAPDCGLAVTPTRRGGDRPRAHNRPDSTRCPGPPFTLPRCDRCGGTADEPRDGCHSPLFHPETWHARVGRRSVEVGNAAAAGAIVGVNGPTYQWLTRSHIPDGPRRAPRHKTVRLDDGVRGYVLDEVREFAKNRPGPGAPGYLRPTEHAEVAH